MIAIAEPSNQLLESNRISARQIEFGTAGKTFSERLGLVLQITAQSFLIILNVRPG
jgi:hypothetical protein